ncbi:biotin carboxyl carrier domain-containing protein [Neobacillus cucumis]|uniref:acetyl-CoA carboxylase n=1 Tax=Neobacillus cucumis TaxID=1740721 RepID=UPI0018E028E8|nr:acetyl-CoA carboxylase [Neobacillus cucumis]MBI0578808.1 biotin carboxyl carrier domain-containing protein [Neobacillus cucumis]
MTTQTTIVSPIPGVFYRKPAPDQPEYVSLGQEVKAGDTIGLIEVMKTFYELKAEQDGVIKQILVESEDIVDAGQDIAVLIIK